MIIIIAIIYLVHLFIIEFDHYFPMFTKLTILFLIIFDYFIIIIFLIYFYNF